MLDFYVENGGAFPDIDYMRKEVCHDLYAIYSKSKDVALKRSVSFTFLSDLDDQIHQNMLAVLSEFAKGDRYSNINLLVGKHSGKDPVAAWHDKVDSAIFQRCVSASRRSRISAQARIIEELTGDLTSVDFIGEDGAEITAVRDASFRTGAFQSVAPWRQLFVLQIIRYWVELLCELQYKAAGVNSQDIPFFSELFGFFLNGDDYIRKRKAWDKL